MEMELTLELVAVTVGFSAKSVVRKLSAYVRENRIADIGQSL